MTRINITREELYNRVWSKPMTKVAPEFHLSDKGLGKICKKHDIPIPYAGYWARLYNGHTPPKTKIKGDLTTKIEIYVDEKKNTTNVTKNKSKLNEISKIKLELHKIKLKLNRNLEPSESINKYINKFKLDKYKPYQQKFLTYDNLHLSKANLSRATKILSYIEQMTKHFDGKLEYEKSSLIVSIWEQRFEITLQENPKKIITGKHIEGESFWQREVIEFVYEETNQFSLHICHCEDMPRSSYNDTETQEIEDILPNFFIQLYKYKEHHAKAIKQRKYEELKRESERKAWRQESLLDQEYNEKIRHLYEQMEKWEKADRVRRYISAFTKTALKHKNKISDIHKLNDYIRFINKYALKLDPISEYFK